MTRPSLAGIEQRDERSPMSTWTAVPALTAARVSEAQVHQIADALWDDMIGASRSTVRNVLRDLFVSAGIEVAS